VLCNLLGGEMDRGLLPRDFELVGRMVRDICFGNAHRYFGLPELRVAVS
jgi:glucuronate isomerase